MTTTVIGDRNLSAWSIAPGVVWIQSRDPLFTRKLSQVAGSRVVAFGVVGGYLRSFEFARSLGWAKRLVARYQKKCAAPANGKFSTPKSPRTCRSAGKEEQCKRRLKSAAGSCV